MVASEAVGMAVVSVAFAVYFGILAGSLPTPHPEAMVQMSGAASPPNGGDRLAYWGSGKSVENLAVYGVGSVNLGVLSDVRHADAAVVSASFFPLLQLNVAQGRALIPADEAPVRQHHVVISDALWQSVFAGAPGIIGARLLAQGQAYTVVGVMPACLIAACILWLAVWFSGSLMFVVRSMRGASNVAVKLALGATRTRIFAEAFNEIVVLVLVSSIFALLFAWGLIEYLSRVGAEVLSGLVDFRMECGVAALVVLISAIASIAVYTLVVSLRLIDIKAATSMAGVSTTTGHRQEMRWLAFLVAIQMAVAVVLLSTAETASEAIIKSSRESLGFKPEQTFVFRYSLPSIRYSDEDGSRAGRFARVLVGQLRTIPGVIRAGEGNALPMLGDQTNYFVKIKRVFTGVSAMTVQTSGDYLGSLGARLRAGRMTGDEDTAATEKVAVVIEGFERRFFPGESALGKQITLEGESTRTVVGVIEDVEFEAGSGDTVPEVYIPQTQVSGGSLRIQSVIMRLSGVPADSILKATKEKMFEIDREIAVQDATTLSKVVERSRSIPDLRGGITGSLGAFALAIVFISLYGLLAFQTLARQRELCIRIALGASRTGIVRLFLTQIGIAAAGGVLGGASLQ
jgi:putative ABC transport system permease protein